MKDDRGAGLTIISHCRPTIRQVVENTPELWEWRTWQSEGSRAGEGGRASEG